DLGFAAARLAVDPTGKWLVADPGFLAHPGIAVVELASRRVTQIAAHVPARAAIDATRVAITDGSGIALGELGTWRPLGRLAGHQSNVTDVWFLPDGRLASSGMDAQLIVWSRAGTFERALATDADRVWAVAASRDGAVFATAGQEGVIRIWD